MEVSWDSFKSKGKCFPFSDRFLIETKFHSKETLRKKREEEEAMWSEYIEQRKRQRSKEEEELKKLKERQVCFLLFDLENEFFLI